MSCSNDQAKPQIESILKTFNSAIFPKEEIHPQNFFWRMRLYFLFDDTYRDAIYISY